jgi:hypothetical protein
MSENPTQSPVEGEIVAEDGILPVIEQSSATAILEKSAYPKAAGAEIGLFTSIGFALGFSALLFLNTYGIPAVLALIFSSIGLVQIKRKGEAGRAFAIWGIVLALVSLVWLGLQYLGLINTSGMLFNFIKGFLGFRT